MKELHSVKFTKDCGQAQPNKKPLKDPDVPRKNTNPKEEQDKLPTKTKKKAK
jgi:hypothetical protein